MTISGAGFAAGMADLEVSINSVPTRLAAVATDQVGAFAATVALPTDLPDGEHNVVVAYQGNERVRVPVQVLAPVADSFVEALTVGFAGQNDELLAGLAILGGLVVAGGVTILVTSGARRRA